jgi:hypothetical protein
VTEMVDRAGIVGARHHRFHAEMVAGDVVCQERAGCIEGVQAERTHRSAEGIGARCVEQDQPSFVNGRLTQVGLD